MDVVAISKYLVQVHDDGDVEICKTEQSGVHSYLEISTSTELFRVLKDYGLGEHETLEIQLHEAGDSNQAFPWTRIY